MADQAVPDQIVIDRDYRGTARVLRHFQAPFTDPSIDPGHELPSSNRTQRLVLSYLAAVGGYLGVTSGHIAHLSSTLDSRAPSERPGVQFRWGDGMLVRDGEVMIWWLAQTQIVPAAGKSTGTDVWGAGLRVVVHDKSMRITASVSTAIYDLNPDLEEPRPVAPGREDLSDEQVLILVAKLLALPPLGHTLEGKPLGKFVYRLNPMDLSVAFVPQGSRGSSSTFGGQTRESSLPGARSGPDDRFVTAVDFSNRGATADITGYRTLVDAGAKQIVYLKELVACQMRGSVFDIDPYTRGGPAAPGVSAYDNILDRFRTTVALPGLAPPPNTRLQGELVEIMDVEGNPGGPMQTGPGEFHFHVRTNDFAAVNAYFHCDSIFRRVFDYGFPLDQYFDQGQFPVSVLPRARLTRSPGDSGIYVNAQVRQVCGGALGVPGQPSRRIQDFRFALADLADPWSPLGIAADRRTVWHEFCHALLIASTLDPQFGFAHSAGDALAAIDSDPDTAFDGEARGETFPWTWRPRRRHDRRAEDGWAWSGTLYRLDDPRHPGEYRNLTDPSGYCSEQILSSTLFRIYRAAGGDAKMPGGAPDVARRRRAADYLIYLIVYAIGGQGAAQHVPTALPEDFAAALMQADVFTGLFTYGGDRRPGGTLHKVIRWAFEKQGLYQPAPGWPQNHAGAPEPVDVYIEDEANRHGEYMFTEQWHALPGALWLTPGGPFPGAPQLGRRSHVHVRVSNRGSMTAGNAEVSVFEAHGAHLDHWPGGWTALNLAAGGVVGKASIPPGGTRVLGPFVWTPRTRGRVGLLAAASASGDLPNTASSTMLPCAAGPTAIGDLVPLDNNLAFRTWTI